MTKGHKLLEKQISDFEKMLRREEKAAGTVEKYVRDVQSFAAWLKGRAVNRELVSEWKEMLIEAGYAPVTINAALSALNKFFHFMCWEKCCVNFLRVQRRIFRDRSRELTKEEYICLLETAHKQGRARLALLLETICSTGIRVSETHYITVEAAQRGEAEIVLKGKIRVILLPGKLCRKLLKYARKEKIISGEIFLTKSGKGLSRQQIWAEMKQLCQASGVEPSKVFPHNLRHLFAITFYRVCRDIVKLADILGHSSIETTRIYLVTTSAEHARQLDRLGLIC